VTEESQIDLMKILFEGDSRDGVSSLAVSRTSKPFICSGHYDFVVRVWDLIERKLLFILKGHIDWVVSVAIWKGVEPLAVSGSSDGTIKIWDLQTGKPFLHFMMLF
jgi:WD40 repeat protein